MKNSKSLLLAVLLVGFTSSAAMAEEGKVYAAIDLGRGSAADFCEGVPAGLSCNDTTTAYRFGLGYQVNKNVGVEAGYLDAGKVNVSGTYLGVPVSAAATMSGFQLSAIGSVPISNEFALLGKAGIALIDGKRTYSEPGYSESANYSNSNFTFGFGARFKANDKIAIRAMFEDFGTIKVASYDPGSKVTMLSAGLEVGF